MAKANIIYNVKFNEYLTDGAVMALLASGIDPTSGRTG